MKNFKKLTAIFTLVLCITFTNQGIAAAPGSGHSYSDVQDNFNDAPGFQLLTSSPCPQPEHK